MTRLQLITDLITTQNFSLQTYHDRAFKTVTKLENVSLIRQIIPNCLIYSPNFLWTAVFLK